jgi:malate dehydrogenase
MRAVAVIGAGDLGATLARRIAELELAQRVVLVDGDEGRARGKALDIAQAGPVEGYDSRVEGRADLASGGPWDAVVLADHAALEAPRALTRAGEVLAALVPADFRGPLLIASEQAPSLIEAAVESGRPRERVLGSSPVAVAAAIRRRLAEELSTTAREIALTVLGLPPDQLVVPGGAATVGGVPLERLAPVALRRAVEAAARPRGPVALAAAAVRVLCALEGARATTLPVALLLQGEYGHRGAAVAAPARIAAGRVESIVEVELQPMERVRFDNAVQRRLDSRPRVVR